MVNKVTIEEEPTLFFDIKECSIETDEDHRKGSSYFRTDIIEFKEEDKEYYPKIENFEQYVGTWQTNTIIDDHEYGTDEKFSVLTRVEKVETVSYKWVNKYE